MTEQLTLGIAISATKTGQPPAPPGKVPRIKDLEDLADGVPGQLWICTPTEWHMARCFRPAMVSELPVPSERSEVPPCGKGRVTVGGTTYATYDGPMVILDCVTKSELTVTDLLAIDPTRQSLRIVAPPREETP